MCGKMLRWLRRDMKFEPRDMCAVLNLPRRTYQDYEAGKRTQNKQGPLHPLL